jgi:hypothetical protein
MSDARWQEKPAKDNPKLRLPFGLNIVACD